MLRKRVRGQKLRAISTVPGLFLLIGLVLLAFQKSNAAPPQPELVVQNGHRSGINSIAFSPDGRYMVTAGKSHEYPDFSIRIWDVDSWRLIRHLNKNAAVEVCSLAFNPDGKTLAAADSDGAVTFWDMATLRALKTEKKLKEVDNCDISISYGPEGAIMASGNGKVAEIIWDTKTWTQLKEIPKEPKVEEWIEILKAFPVFLSSSEISFNPEKRTLVLQGAKKIEVWNTERSEKLCEIALPDYAEAMAISPAGDKIALAVEKQIGLWGTGECGLIGNLEISTDEDFLGFDAVSFSPDGKLLAAGREYGRLDVWDVESGKSVKSDDGKYAKEWTYSINYNNAVSFSAAYDRAAFGYQGGFSIIDAKSGKTTAVQVVKPDPEDEEDTPTIPVAVDPAGRLVATSHMILNEEEDEIYVITLWNALTGKKIKTIKAGMYGIKDLKFSPDGKLLMASDHLPLGDQPWGTIGIWNVQTGRRIKLHLDPEIEIGMAVFGRGSNILAMIGENVLYAWDIRRNRKIYTDDPSGKPYDESMEDVGGDEEDEEPISWVNRNCVAISPDGRSVAEGLSSDSIIRISALPSGKEIKILRDSCETDVNCVRSLVFSNDGKFLISSGPSSIIVWDIQRGKKRSEYRIWGPGGKKYLDDIFLGAFGMKILEMSRDGRFIIFMDQNEVTRVMDWSTGKTRLYIETFRTGDWVSYTPSNNFSASVNAPEFLAWTVGMKSYPLSNYEAKYRSPGLIFNVLNGK